MVAGSECDDVEALRNEMFRKVGRNVFKLQKLEALLKHLVFRSRLSFEGPDFEHAAPA